MKVVTVAQMQQAERDCARFGISLDQLMENAGSAVAGEIRRILGEIDTQQILILVGPGNNGGDGMVAARYLHDWGASVIVYLCGKRPEKDPNQEMLKSRKIAWAAASDDDGLNFLRRNLEQSGAVVDSIFGTGQNRPLTGIFAEVLNLVAEYKKEHPSILLFAIDLPSGLNADNGQADQATLNIDHTIALGCPKVGLFNLAGQEKAGELTVADIGIPPQTLDQVKTEFMDDDWARTVLPGRPRFSHKGTFGKILAWVGSPNYIGAAYLACSGSIRVGAGLTTMAIPKSLIPRKLRMALVGGGQGAFIGRVHAIAAVLDNRAELVAGALSSDPAKAKASAPDYDIKPDRAYGSIQELIAGELKLPASERIDFVSVATPNHTHFEIAKSSAEAGFNVMCDKPMTFDLAQAEELAKVVQRTGVVFAVTHNYTGNPLVRQARDMVLSGELGEIQAIRACYIQGWLRTRLEKDAQKQAAWRTDPKRSGIAGCFGDIGTHAYNLGRFITGLLPDQIACTLKAFEPGRELDDYGTAIIKYQNGALGTVTASQISHGRENDIWIEVDGTKGELEWHQEEPNKMFVRMNGKPHQMYTRAGGPYLGATAGAATRIPPGHPEGYLEAFANIYTAAYNDMAKRAAGEKFDGAGSLYPNVADGVDGMNFITQCVASSKENGAWRSLKHPLCRK